MSVLLKYRELQILQVAIAYAANYWTRVQHAEPGKNLWRVCDEIQQ